MGAAIFYSALIWLTAAWTCTQLLKAEFDFGLDLHMNGRSCGLSTGSQDSSILFPALELIHCVGHCISHLGQDFQTSVPAVFLLPL